MARTRTHRRHPRRRYLLVIAPKASIRAACRVVQALAGEPIKEHRGQALRIGHTEPVLFRRLRTISAALSAAGMRKLRRGRHATLFSAIASVRRLLPRQLAMHAPVPVLPETSTWARGAVGADTTGLTGAGVRVAVLDTGVDLSHPDLHPAETKSLVAGQTADDVFGHGTHCAGLIAGIPAASPRYSIAPGVSLFIGKIRSNSNKTDDALILAGIEWAMSRGCTIVSLSQGRSVLVGETHNSVFEITAARALSKGTLVIAGAGNSGPTRAVEHPANCPSVLCIGAVTRHLHAASFSNRRLNDDGKVDAAGPGVDVGSAWLLKNGGYRVMSGTSAAVPIAAATAALIQEDTGFQGKALWAELLRRVDPLTGESETRVGAGLVQAS